MSDLTTRLLAEIDRRERRARVRVEYADVKPEVRRYLGALREIVRLHTGPHRCHDLDGTVDIVRDECDTLLAVAAALGVDA